MASMLNCSTASSGSWFFWVVLDKKLQVDEGNYSIFVLGNILS